MSPYESILAPIGSQDGFLQRCAIIAISDTIKEAMEEDLSKPILIDDKRTDS